MNTTEEERDVRAKRYPYVPLRLHPDVLRQIEEECHRRHGINRQEFLREAVLYFLPASRRKPGLTAGG